MEDLHSGNSVVLCREMLELLVRLADFHFTHGKADGSAMNLPERVKMLFNENIMPTYEDLLAKQYVLPVWRHPCVRVRCFLFVC